jgi:1-aminocyclopropane-1-carboxylate deaminase
LQSKIKYKRYMDIDYQNITIDELQNELFTTKQVTLAVLRLDKIDPILSGNKLFKLHYFLQQAKEQNKNTIVTFGGAYSNHLAATAYACKLNKLQAIGIIRGEKPATLSHTLQHCVKNNMQLQFISRAEYDKKETSQFLATVQNQYENTLVIPEGGFGSLGSKGAGLIMDVINVHNYTHICLAVGSATTYSGIIQNATKSQQIIAIPVLKGMTDLEERMNILIQQKYNPTQLTTWSEYHFGGYAKKTTALFNFMNECWVKYKLPLDFVYTAKAFYGVIDKIGNDFFPPSSNILFIHTGGLQGNLSLPANTLLF